MNVYRFLGAYSEIGGVGTFDSLGQSIKLEPKAALEAMRGGVVLIPDAEYQKLGFTKDEEKVYQYAGARATAPASFKEKFTAAVKVYQKLLDEADMANFFPPDSIPVVPVVPVAPVPVPAPTKPTTEAKQ